MTKPENVSLSITSKAMTGLHEQKKEDEKKRMLARIEKDKTRMVSRRAKQEQQLAYRAEKRAIFQIAKNCDALIEARCRDLEEAMKLRGDAKATIKGAEVVLATLEKKHDGAVERAAKARQVVGRLEAEIADAVQALEEAKAPTDPSIMELKRSRLQDASTTGKAAWEQVQKSIRKKDLSHRRIKSWAKKLLG